MRALSHALETGRLHQAYLFHRQCAVWARRPSRDPCENSELRNWRYCDALRRRQTCQDIDAGRFPDLIEFDAASNTGVDNMREIIDNAALR